VLLSGGILGVAGWAAALLAEAATRALGSRADAAWLLPAAFAMFGLLQVRPASGLQAQRLPCRIRGATGTRIVHEARHIMRGSGIAPAAGACSDGCRPACT